jgi:hypothetical protein
MIGDLKIEIICVLLCLADVFARRKREMSLDFVADLHNHTTASDGEYTPAELIAKAKELGCRRLG